MRIFNFFVLGFIASTVANAAPNDSTLSLKVNGGRSVATCINLTRASLERVPGVSSASPEVVNKVPTGDLNVVYDSVRVQKANLIGMAKSACAYMEEKK